MSILIKGMEMPKSCFECPFMLHRCFCLINPRIEFTDEEYSELKGRYSGCPLVPVPPHGRLIDADALEHIIGQFSLNWEYGQGVSDCWNALLASPTIIEAEEET